MDTGIQATTDGLVYAHSKGVAVVIMEPLKGGQLANPPDEALKIMRAAENGRTPVDWALQFLWNRPEVATVLSDMGNQQMVDENCASADRLGINTLSPEEEDVIARLAEVYRSKILVPCTACEYCMPCPAGVNIPQNFAILNNVSLEAAALAWPESHTKHTSNWYNFWGARPLRDISIRFMLCWAEALTCQSIPPIHESK